MLKMRGVRTHNLKNIDLDLPHNQLIVITGLSGSGKSSLAFDTLYAEGQRRYVESLSAYARQFLSVMDKPELDAIEGLSPAIAIEQKSASHNPRSTVGTITEIYDYLRLLYARAGQAYCPAHHIHLHAQPISQMVDTVLALPSAQRFMLLAPVVKDRKGEHLQLLDSLRKQGFIRVRINGFLMELDDLPSLNPQQKHHIEVVIDRFKISPTLSASRLSESFATALRLGNGVAWVMPLPENNTTSPSFTATDIQIFSSNWACPICQYSLPELEPRLFSFNNPTGACPHCSGLGIDPAQAPALEKLEIPASTIRPCPLCAGSRLNLAARHVFIADRNLPALTALSVADAHAFLTHLKLPGQQGIIAAKILQEILERLQFLLTVGLHYLTLDRRTDTLSGGEAQRIRLASQIGSGLMGVLYILDEPSIGLHPRDNERLLKTLFRLRDLGNTIIVVEHDEDTIRRADYIVDMGPGAGIHGGEIVAQGLPDTLMRQGRSLTGQYLSGLRAIPIPQKRIAPTPGRYLRIEKASGHNLKHLTVEIPLGLITGITGVSGSGKSTLINDTLYPVAAQRLNGAQPSPVEPYAAIEGLEYLDKVIAIDQSPIGRTPRSNPATYTGLFTPIRELFAATPEARARGYDAGRFSFNIKGGRCEACEGDGVTQVAMHFLPDIYVRCEVCQGQRYNRETLEIRYKHKTISEVLSLTVEAAATFFQAIPAIMTRLKALQAVGLGYLQLGQSATTLSGGEAQRVKLAKELSRRDTGKTLYILDEPTTGLHWEDVAQLLTVLQTLRDHKNTIIIIEHHLEVIKTVDWIIDLGPEGGDEGGQLVVAGTPETVAQYPASYTGQCLTPILLKN